MFFRDYWLWLTLDDLKLIFREKNHIVGVYDKFLEIAFDESKWKIDFLEISNENVAAAVEGLSEYDLMPYYAVKQVFQKDSWKE